MQESQRRQDCQFSVTADMDRMLDEFKENIDMQEAALWANCDPDSLYPYKSSDKCNVGTISIASDD